MTRCHLVAASKGLAESIAARARPADIAELLDGSGTTPLQAMLDGMERSPHVAVGMRGDVPVCMFGAVPFSALSGKAAVWMIGSRELDRPSVQRDLLRLSVQVIDDLQARYPALLYNFVDERNTRAIRWLRWLGFRFAPAIPFGVKRKPFLPFYRFEVPNV